MTVSRREPHLGELAAALVDGALDHGARDRALIHVARCDECRAEVEAQRRLKAQLANMLTPSAPTGLAERLRMLPDRLPPSAPVELPPDRFGARFRSSARVGSYGRAPDGRTLTTIAGSADRFPPVPPAPVRAEDRPVSMRPGGVAAASRGPGRRMRSRRRRYAATAAGGLAAFALALAAVAAAGEGAALEPVAPQVGTFIMEHGQVTGGMPGPAAEVGVVDAVNVGR